MNQYISAIAMLNSLSFTFKTFFPLKGLMGQRISVITDSLLQIEKLRKNAQYYSIVGKIFSVVEFYISVEMVFH